MQRLGLTLRSRLVFGYGSVLLMLLLFGLANVYLFNQVSKASQTLRQEAQSVSDAQDLFYAALNLVVALDEAILTQDLNTYTEVVDPALEELERQHEIFKQTFTETISVDMPVSNIKFFVQPMKALAETESWSVMRLNRLTGMDQKIDRLSEALTKFVTEAQDRQDRASARVQQAQHTAYLSIVLSLVSAFAISVVTGYTTIRSVVRSTSVLLVGAERLAAGDLEQRVVVESKDESGRLAIAFNQMAEQLQSLYARLEQRVLDRTRELERRSGYLEASAQVGRASASILNADELIEEVVELIRHRFNLYYVGLFLVDRANEWAVLCAGTGEAGKSMLARAHRIKVGEGMIGWSVANAQWRVALEVEDDTVRKVTVELPDTRSEAALPLRSRGRVIGALTVQDDEPGTFDQDTMVVLQTMADQVAVAIDNANLFAASEAALEAQRRAYGEFSRDVWADITRARQGKGYRYTPQLGVVDAPIWYPEMEIALQNGQIVQPAAADQVQSLAIPLQVRDQVIGVIGAKSAGSRRWTSEDISLLQSLVEQIGLALDNARLFQSVQSRAVYERLATEITDRIRVSTEVDTILQIAVRELGRALHAAEGTIQLEVADAPDADVPQNGQSFEIE